MEESVNNVTRSKLGLEKTLLMEKMAFTKVLSLKKYYQRVKRLSNWIKKEQLRLANLQISP